MKLAKLREDRDTMTAKLGDIVRQLDFAGIAVIWIFRSEDAVGFLLWPLGLFVVSLALDLGHYVWSSAVLEVLSRKHDKAAPEDDLSWSRGIFSPARVFLWAKTVACVLAYGSLLYYVGARLW